jgi:hypothetical protein
VEGRYKGVMCVVTTCRNDKSVHGVMPMAHLADGKFWLVLIKACNHIQVLPPSIPFGPTPSIILALSLIHKHHREPPPSLPTSLTLVNKADFLETTEMIILGNFVSLVPALDIPYTTAKHLKCSLTSSKSTRLPEMTKYPMPSSYYRGIYQACYTIKS